jgi:bifunctional DNase/RNase
MAEDEVPKDDEVLEMNVEGLTLDPLTNMPIIILKDPTGKRALPIWVGIFEANAIALEMEKVSTPRPMTHDLIKNILDGINATVKQICVNDLRDNTFFAEIMVQINGAQYPIDSRPSDAIALALRVNAPIFVAKKVIEEARSIDLGDDAPLEDKDQWKNWLDNLKPGDFGKMEG